LAFLSIGYCSVSFNSPNPSIGFQRASTTLPIKLLPTGTLKTSPVALAISHSLILLNHSKITTQTKCSSKFMATHFAPLANSTSSLKPTFLRPETLATQSQT